MSARTAAVSGRLALVLAILALPAVLVPSPAGAAREHTIGAFFIAYLPDTLTINKGDSLTFVNTDPFAGPGHTVTQATSTGVVPRFDSGIVPFGAAADVKGVPELPQGEYLIQCQVHPIMTAALYVGAESRSPVDTITDLLDDDFLP
jgi:plastocyanin